VSKSSIFFSTQIWPIFVITLRNDQNISDLFSERFCFSDWPNHSIPMVSAGVYVVWQGDLLIYAGMSGRQTEKNLGKKKYGLITRLDSHAKGRLSGDQFNVYVANRLVIPKLAPDQFVRFAEGTLTLDLLTRQHIHENFEYQYLIVEASAEAFQLERLCQSGAVFGQKPYLNPIVS